MLALMGWMVRAIAAKGWSIARGLSIVIVLAGSPAIASASASASEPLFEMALGPTMTLNPPSSSAAPEIDASAEVKVEAEPETEAPLPFSDPGDLFFGVETPPKQTERAVERQSSASLPMPQPKQKTKTLGQRLAAAAIATEGADVTMGPGRGSLACAWAVNRFGLQPVLGRKVGKNPNLVVSVQRDLVKEGLAVEVPQSAAQPGDIVVTAGPGRSQHIGIVVSKRSGAGVEALSTRGGRWGWRSDLNFQMKYKVKGRIYRLKDKPVTPRPKVVKPKPKTDPAPLKAQTVANWDIPDTKPLFFDAALPQSTRSRPQSSTPVSRSLSFTPSDQAIPFNANLPIPGAQPAVQPVKNLKPVADSGVNQWFADRRSLGAVAIGHAEGNLSETGKIRSIYYGHSDPGNGVKNIGFCSLQRYLWQDFNGDGKVSFPEADRRCLDLLRGQAPKTAEKLLDFGYTAVKHPEATLNGLDLYNQSRVAGRQFPKRYRQARDRGLTGEQAIVWARVESFRVLKGRNKGKLSASGLFRICRNSPQRRHLSDWNCIAKDQRRRVRAIHRVLKAQPPQSR